MRRKSCQYYVATLSAIRYRSALWVANFTCVRADLPDLPDTFRGYLNEGGLYAERIGARIYRTTFDLVKTQLLVARNIIYNIPDGINTSTTLGRCTLLKRIPSY